MLTSCGAHYKVAESCNDYAETLGVPQPGMCQVWRSRLFTCVGSGTGGGVGSGAGAGVGGGVFRAGGSVANSRAADRFDQFARLQGSTPIVAQSQELGDLFEFFSHRNPIVLGHQPSF